MNLGRKKGTSKTGGRKAGTPNKFTKNAKEAFQFAFDKLGGAEGLAEWGQTKKEEFYKLYAKLIPMEITTDKDFVLIVRYVDKKKTSD